MIQTVYQSSKLLSHRLVHAICCEMFTKGNFKGSATFTGVELVIRTEKELPEKVEIVSHGQRIALVKKEQSGITMDFLEKDLVQIEGLFSYAKTPSKKEPGMKNLAVIGPKNVVNEALLKEFCQKNLGVLIDDYEIVFVENYVAKDNMIINNCFRLKASGIIENSQTVRTNIILGSGQKKSYGFGLINYNKKGAL